MTRIVTHPTLVLLAASGLALAQSAPPAAAQQDPTQPVARSDAYGQPQRPTPPPAARPAYGLPAQVTLKPGTFVTIRINEGLASNRNQPGDTFTGVLEQPVVVDSVVIANRGQSVWGRVAEADKVKGVSRLGVELTSLTLADGSQVSIHSQMVSRRGPTAPGEQQAGAIITTTAVGAAVGAAADYGRGAAIGAGAGAAAGILGVLATRNHPSVLYPETALTFEITSPLTVAVGNAPQAYRFVGPEDYERPATQVVQRPVAPRTTYFYGPGYYPYPYYPYFWGPGISFGIGGFYRPGFYHGGFRRFR